MANTLVAYFSLTGHTKQVAEEIARELHADLDQIVDVAARTFTPGHMIWFAMEALLRQSPDIQDPRHDPSDYDLVIIGTPVWAGNMASPVRTYVERYKAQFKRIALFCTEGGSNGEHALRQIADAAEARPVAQVIITEAELTSGAYKAKTTAFAQAVAGVSA